MYSRLPSPNFPLHCSYIGCSVRTVALAKTRFVNLKEQNPEWLEVYYGPLLIGRMNSRKQT